MADKTRKTRLARLTLLQEFETAPLDALFTQATVAALRDCSIANIERDRWRGTGIPFRRIGHSIRYSKRDILAWLSQYQPVRSTAEADAQVLRLRGALNVADRIATSGEG
jgi:hypothetical protein